MKKSRELNSIEEILSFAIEKEQEAADFYSDWSGKVSSKSIAEVLRGFAGEERKHKAYISDIKSGKKVEPAPREVTDLSISDYLVEVSPSEDMDYQKALMVGMQREKSSYRLYTELADRIPDADVKNLFLTLAQEEAKHKLRLELIYDEEILGEN